MPVSLGLLRRARERYAKMSDAERAEEDAYWTRVNRRDNWVIAAICVLSFVGFVGLLAAQIR